MAAPEIGITGAVIASSCHTDLAVDWTTSDPLLFISHQHADPKFAEVILPFTYQRTDHHLAHPTHARNRLQAANPVDRE